MPHQYPNISLIIRLAIALVACCIALGLEWARPGLISRFDEDLRDVFLQIKSVKTQETRITVVDIDDESLREIGSWPWPRSRIADLVEILIENYGAKAVGLDIVFPEWGEEPEGDARLILLAKHASITLAQIFDYVPRSPNLAVGTIAGGERSIAERPAMDAHGYIANHNGLHLSRCVGNIGYVPDADGVLRHIPALTRFQGLDYPSFSLALLGCLSGRQFHPADLPVADKLGLWRVPYRYDVNSYSIVPASSVLQGNAPKDLFNERYVLVGSSSLSLGDRVSTPLSPLVPGFMVHAASLSGLLDQMEGENNASRSGRTPMVAWILGSTLLAVFCIAQLPAWGGVFLLLGLSGVWTTVAFWGVVNLVEWSIFAPLSGYFFLLLVAVPYEWWRSQQKNLHLIDSLAHYVAKPVLDEILRSSQVYSLDPTLREVTVLIADMEGYTRTTSALTLQDAADLTKGFLDCLTRPVLDGLGTLDKYSGDGMVAFWGAPLLCQDQADRSVTAALQILCEVEIFNEHRQKKGFQPVKVRIGIESGMALVGDLGTNFRSTYTAVGDCINFASRLESAARGLNTQLLIGPVTNGKLMTHETLSLGTVYLRDTEMKIEVFSVKLPKSKIA